MLKPIPIQIRQDIYNAFMIHYISEAFGIFDTYSFRV
jgi:hypothetical protein